MTTPHGDSGLPLWLEQALDGADLGEGATHTAMVLASTGRVELYMSRC